MYATTIGIPNDSQARTWDVVFADEEQFNTFLAEINDTPAFDGPDKFAELF